MLTIEMILACTIGVSPVTVQDIVEVESGGDPLALNINGIGQEHAQDVSDGIRQAHAAIDAGRSVDMGYMQVNSTTASALGYSVEQMFDPCTNLKAGAEVLKKGYEQASSSQGGGQRALQTALSLYNTGDPERGFANGYVARYYGPRSAPPAASPANPYTVRPTVYTRPTPLQEPPK